MFKLKIETDNAAFDESPHEEIIRILMDAIDALKYGNNDFTMHDINGNWVGEYKLTRKVKK